MNLCIICLRTDRMLKVANNVLQEFYDELCEFSVVTMTLCCYYCSECEYLLTKFYKFKQKCVKALKIYQKWMSAKAGRKHPKKLIYTLLPPSSLAMCISNPEKIGNFTFKSADLQTDVCNEKETQEPTIEVKLEYDSSDTIKLADVLKTENSENIPEKEHNEVNNDSETKDLLLENIDKLDQLSDSDTTDQESTDSNITNHETEHRIKKTAKKNEKRIENVLNSENTNIKMTAKKKAYFEKFRENDEQYKSVFDIEYLTTPEVKLEEFGRRKTYEHYVKAKHKCEICYQVVKSSKYLEYHMNKWHNESQGSVLCPICNTWNSKRSKHRRTHIVVFKCKLCSLVTYHRKSMQNHFEQHKGKQYHCEQCNITYKSNSAYRNHMGKVHRRGRNVCEGCGRGFGSPLGLKIHKNNSFRCTVAKEPSTSLTDPTEGVRCEDCDVTLPSQQVYDAHIIDVHEPRRKRPLTINSAGLPEPRVNAQKFRKRVRRTPEHTCRVCSKVGVSFGWLQLHFKREHPDEDIDVLYADKKTHLCDICGTGFSNVYALGSHMNLHTGARPHACDLCPKRFRSAYLMREHRVRHFPSTVSCTTCGKEFKTRANLYTHMKVHTGEKDHICDICGKGFAQRVNLREHVRGVHYNIRRVRRGGAREGGVQEGGVREGGAGAGPKRTKRKTVPDDTKTDDFDDSE